MSDSELTYSGIPDQPDLNSCDREPIHLLGRVQNFGCLIATTSDWIINHASENTADFLGFEAHSAIGSPLEHFFPSAAMSVLRNRFQTLIDDAGLGRVFGLNLFGTGELFDIHLHRSGKSLVFEFERKGHHRQSERDELGVVMPLLANIQRQQSLQDLTQEAARGMGTLTGFDRVMIYKFKEDESGVVIAEHCPRGAEQYLGLHFPQYDIPKQARALLKRNGLRLISNVNEPGSQIIPATGSDGRLIDLSMSTTRAPSLIHLEYLQNMGVGASLVYAIVNSDKLWGLIACHHSVPRYLDYETRTSVELFGQLVAYEILRKESAVLHRLDYDTREMHTKLMAYFSDQSDFHQDFNTVSRMLSKIIPNDGIAIYSGGLTSMDGCTPTRAEFDGLVRFLNTTQSGCVFLTNALAQVFPDAAAFEGEVAGLLAIPISRVPRDYIVFFRKEIATTVTWAGRPEATKAVGAHGDRLTPRKSFDAWKQEVRGTCLAWSPEDIRAAEALRVSLIEVVLKLTDLANKERLAANEQQELLIAELNHRVRNILTLIQGLISQSKSGLDSVESFASVLDGRVQALARAHDQLTAGDWGEISLKELIAVEAKAFLNGKSERVVVNGPEVTLKPSAFSAMALVFHELLTNAAKYGSLSDQHGSVMIDLHLQTDGSLAINWVEQGGPPVQATKRKGFGTTIIERSIPFELKGTAELRMELTGVEGHFKIPAECLGQVGMSQPNRAQPPVEVESVDGKISGNALIVEDNMIIAYDSADMLGELVHGRVCVSSHVAEAIEMIEEHPFAVALLDVNLGSETSLPVAKELEERGIPFLLATGYGEVSKFTEAYPKAPILKKPYTYEMVRKHIMSLVPV